MECLPWQEISAGQGSEHKSLAEFTPHASLCEAKRVGFNSPRFLHSARMQRGSLKEEKMYRVTRQIFFCYGHRLLDYEGKCRNFHGHNGKVEVELEAETLDGRGMVYDFTEIKSVIKDWIDEKLDHRMILNRKDPLLGALQKAGEPLYLMDENPTAEAIARLIYEYALSKGFPISEVRLWETDESFATYHR